MLAIKKIIYCAEHGYGIRRRHGRYDIPWQAWKQGLDSALVIGSIFTRLLVVSSDCTVSLFPQNQKAYMKKVIPRTDDINRLKTWKHEVNHHESVYLYLKRRWGFVSSFQSQGQCCTRTACTTYHNLSGVWINSLPTCEILASWCTLYFIFCRWLREAEIYFSDFKVKKIATSPWNGRFRGIYRYFAHKMWT